MSVELTGTLIEKRQIVTGESSRGTWQKQEIIIETNEQYPKKICLVCWGERIDDIKNVEQGTVIKAAVDIESREYNGRWYTDVKVWRFQPVGNTGTMPPLPEPPPFDRTSIKTGQGTSFNNDEMEDDLPF
ncbi:MAG: DUF3127 domain-containing protein [Flavobacteriales bacterium]|nr:DUF3127 domain-containing protein [Flavobacteriales bacterium]